MMDHKMKIKSDKYKGYMEHKKKMAKEMGMDMGDMGECVPVDLYGKRTITAKGHSPSLEEMGEDIKEVHGLEDY